MGAEGDRNLYSCKGFVECLPSPLKKKWKHMWISHPIPFSASYSQSIGKRKVLKHRWCSTERWDLVIWQTCAKWIHTGHYWQSQGKTGWKINTIIPTCMKWTKTTEIMQILQSFLMTQILESQIWVFSNQRSGTEEFSRPRSSAADIF